MAMRVNVIVSPDKTIRICWVCDGYVYYVSSRETSKVYGLLINPKSKAGVGHVFNTPAIWWLRRQRWQCCETMTMTTTTTHKCATISIVSFFMLSTNHIHHALTINEWQQWLGQWMSEHAKCVCVIVYTYKVHMCVCVCCVSHTLYELITTTCWVTQKWTNFSYV